MSKTRTLLAMALAFALAAPLPAQSSLENIARDLNHALGQGHAQLTGKPHRVVYDAAIAQPSVVEDLIADMNRERAANGLGPLHLNQKLMLAASDRLSDMFSKHYFSHVSPDGISPFTWADKRGYDYRLIGENLAVGYRTASSVVDGWMHSPGHRENILKSGFDEIGVAVASGSPTRPFAGPTVVALYGAR